MEGGGVDKTARDTPQVQLSPNGHVTYPACVIRPLSLAVAYTDTTPACLGTPTHNTWHISPAWAGHTHTTDLLHTWWYMSICRAHRIHLLHISHTYTIMRAGHISYIYICDHVYAQLTYGTLNSCLCRSSYSSSHIATRTPMRNTFHMPKGCPHITHHPHLEPWIGPIHPTKPILHYFSLPSNSINCTGNWHSLTMIN